MTVKLKDEPYMILPYGTLAIPLSMASEIIKHSVYVDRNYNSDIHDYEMKIGRPCTGSTLDTMVVQPDLMKAALVASKLENS